MAKHIINYSYISVHSDINTVFCKISKQEKQMLLAWLEEFLLVLGEACHEFKEIRQSAFTPSKQFGKGNMYTRNPNISIMACLCGMLNQHRKTGIKDFTKYQIKNLKLLLVACNNINSILKSQGWPTVNCPDVEFKKVDTASANVVLSNIFE